MYLLCVLFATPAVRGRRTLFGDDERRPANSQMKIMAAGSGSSNETAPTGSTYVIWSTLCYDARHSSGALSFYGARGGALASGAGFD